MQSKSHPFHPTIHCKTAHRRKQGFMVLEIICAQTSHLLDMEHQGRANCNNLSAATEQSQFDNHYLLISFMLRVTWTFLPVPGAYSAICIGKYRGRESPGFTTLRQLPQMSPPPRSGPSCKGSSLANEAQVAISS